MANSYVELGQEDEAVDCINKFLEKEPLNPLALAGKGDILERLGRGTEALACYSKSVEYDPKKAYVWHKLGNLKNERGEFETALDCYNEAVQLISGFEEAWFKIGELLTMENKDEQAKECFSWVLEINPDNPKAKNAMSVFEEPKEFLGSLFKRGKKKHKDGKNRKKRKRKKPKKEATPEFYDEVDNQPVSPEPEFYEEPEPQLSVEEQTPAPDYYEEPEPLMNVEDQAIAPETEYNEESEHLMNVEEQTFAPETEYSEESEPLMNVEDQALAHETEYHEDPAQQPSEQKVPEYQKQGFKEGQPVEPSTENYEESEYQVKEFEVEQPVEPSPVYNEQNETGSENVELPDSKTEWEQALSEVEPEQECGPSENEELDSDLDELQDLIDETPSEIEAVNEEEYQVEENYGLKVLSQEKLEAKKVSQENLQDLDNLLEKNAEPLDLLDLAESPGESDPKGHDMIEGEYNLSITDFFEPDAEEPQELSTESDTVEAEQQSDSVPGLDEPTREEVAAVEEIISELEDLNEIQSASENHDNQDVNDETIDQKELNTSLEDLQEILVEDKAHLDGQKIPIKPSGVSHLDGHPIQDKPQMLKLDAHGPGYMPPADIQASLEKLVNKGKLHMEKGEFKEAMNCFDMALELDPQCVDAWGAKGNLLLEMDEDEEE
jgi:tetratricopeptide (TPR) repeat protein